MIELPSNAPAAINRREFLRGSARYLLLAGLSAVTVRALANGGGRLTGQSCVNEGLCRPCPSFDACGLPQALSLKEAIKQTGDRV